MQILETERLALRWLAADDAEFVHRLVNDPDWVRFIGDRGVRTLQDAREYIRNGPVTMYAQLGFGLYLVELREARVPVGICGLLKRASLDDVDLGFAYLPQFRGRGYALEAAAAVVEHGWRDLRLRRIVAIVSPDNQSSIRLLEKLGMRYRERLLLSDRTEEVCVYVMDSAQPNGPGNGAPTTSGHPDVKRAS